MRVSIAVGLVVAALAATTPAAGAATGSAKTETLSAGPVTATLTYTVKDFVASDVLLSITRAGMAVTSGVDIGAACKSCDGATPIGGLGSGTARDNGSLTIRDLDGDGEPEVIVDLFTGGAHCCSVSVIERFDGTTYRPLAQSWGDPGYSLRDVGGDGRPEFVTRDDSFAYRFCAYVCSLMPVRVLRYEAPGRFTDVTKSLPDVVGKDAAAALKAYHSARSHRSDRFAVKGILPAYCADEYMLGHGAKCRSVLETARKRGELRHAAYDLFKSDHAYISDLLGFLKRTGYR